MVKKTHRNTLEVTEYTYNAEDQLIQVTQGSSITKYHYDGLGRRIYKDRDGIRDLYVYNGANILFEIDDIANPTLSTYTHGAGIDRPLILERNGAKYYYQADHEGSITQIVDSAGATVQQYEYDAFGNIVNSSGTITQPFTYTGREYDAETGLYYYRARYYDPKIGRFLQEDPIWSVNAYAYCYSNPLNLVDPYGLIVEAPGTAESFIPVWGSGRQAIHDYQTGHYLWGTFNAGMAVSDVFLVKSVATGIGKGAWKLGGHSWSATRAWLAKTGQAEAGQQVHHWLIPQGGWGVAVSNAIKNQPWNLMAMSTGLHQAVHGLSGVGRIWFGTPVWFKALGFSLSGRFANLFGRCR
jgi:RHS repeat-associated protein